MSTEENKAFIRRYLDALSGKDKPEALLREYIADEQLIHHIGIYEAALPRYQFVAEDVFAEGDKVAVRAKVIATHEGELMGIPPTGKSVTVPVMIIYRIEDGKIAEHWMNADTLGVLQQIGAMPALG